MFLWLFLVFFLSQYSESVIRDGDLANLQRVPYVVILRSILRSALKKAITCGGTLISADMIVTAAHCFGTPLNKIKRTYIIAGVNGLQSDELQLRNVSRWIRHPDFQWGTQEDFALKFDIALVQVKPNFNMTDFVRPIKIAQEPFPYGVFGTICGKGRVDIDKRNGKYILCRNIERMDPYICKRQGQFGGDIDIFRTVGPTSATFCTFQVTCKGDSGSGVVYKKEVYAVASATHLYFHCFTGFAFGILPIAIEAELYWAYDWIIVTGKKWGADGCNWPPESKCFT